MKLTGPQAQMLEDMASENTKIIRISGGHLVLEKVWNNSPYYNENGKPVVRTYKEKTLDAMRTKGYVHQSGNFMSEYSLTKIGLSHWFTGTTIELLYHKYLYYELQRPIIGDYAYDMIEHRWIQVGVELGFDMENYPNWVDFDRRHPLAKDALKFAKKEGMLKIEETTQ